jgi:ketosteroid isomerase-like protein
MEEDRAEKERFEAVTEVIERLQRATDEHDLDGIVGCFAADYRNETPAHPARGFTGRDQVRANWEMILQSVPDITVRTTRMVVDGGTVWCEMEHHGTRRDGTPHAMTGVILFEVADGLIQSARFYLEPVDASSGGVIDAIRGQVTPTAQAVNR